MAGKPRKKLFSVPAFVLMLVLSVLIMCALMLNPDGLCECCRYAGCGGADR